MAGQPLFQFGDPYGSYSVPGVGNVNGGQMSGNRAASNTVFIIWLVIVGVLLPIGIIGGLKVSGFSFVFKGR